MAASPEMHDGVSSLTPNLKRQTRRLEDLVPKSAPGRVKTAKVNS